MRASVLLLGLALATVAPAQSVVVKATSKAGASTPYDASYQRSSQVTVTGKVIGIGVSKPDQAMPNNVRYVVQTLTKKPSTFLIEAGPQWYVNSQKAHPKLGQWVRVTGSRIIDHGERKILALQVQLHNHDVLSLRRLTGVPYWVDLTPPAQPMTADVAPQTGRLVAEGTILGSATFTINGVKYAGYTVQTANGPANVIVAPPNYTSPVQSYALGDSVRVFSSGYYSPVVVTGGNNNQPYVVASSIYGPNGSVFVGPGMGFYPGYIPW